MLSLDMIKRKLKLKKTLLETKVVEYEKMAVEIRRLQDCLIGRGEFITQLTEEIGQLETTRDEELRRRVSTLGQNPTS
jgi:hypothetical protein